LKINIIEKFGHRLPTIIEKIKTACCKDIRMADIVLSTVHKAKGLEFDTVILLNDFPDFKDNFERVVVSEDEKNLIYVAITRAKTSFVMNNLVKEDILNDDGVNRLVVYKGGETEVQCGDSDCKVDLSDNLVLGQLTLRREAYAMSGRGSNTFNIKVTEAKTFCQECAAQRIPSFHRLVVVGSEKRGVKRKRGG